MLEEARVQPPEDESDNQEEDQKLSGMLVKYAGSSLNH
jgi:hypothetical protein